MLLRRTAQMLQAEAMLSAVRAYAVSMGFGDVYCGSCGNAFHRSGAYFSVASSYLDPDIVQQLPDIGQQEVDSLILFSSK
jgi:hypothetical protein